MQHLTPNFSEYRLRPAGACRIGDQNYELLVGVDSPSNTLRLEVPVPSPDGQLRAVVETTLSRAINNDVHLCEAIYHVLGAAYRLNSNGNATAKESQLMIAAGREMAQRLLPVKSQPYQLLAANDQ